MLLNMVTDLNTDNNILKIGRTYTLVKPLKKWSHKLKIYGTFS